jgi:beta-phosphoglucomutase family hydrolase
MKRKTLEIPADSFKAVIFDMDGTMIDNKDYHTKAWQIFLKKHGINLTQEEFDKRLAGKRNEPILKDLFQGKLTSEEIQKYAYEKEKLYRKLYGDFVKEVDGLKKLLEQIKELGKKIGVATNSPKENLEFIFDNLNLHNFFDATVWDEHISRGKPNPEIYLHIAKVLKVLPESCVVFEDTVTGVKAGKAANMKVVALLTGHSKEVLKEADYFINNFTEIYFP